MYIIKFEINFKSEAGFIIRQRQGGREEKFWICLHILKGQTILI